MVCVLCCVACVLWCVGGAVRCGWEGAVGGVLGHTFSAFRLRSSVVSALISLISDTSLWDMKLAQFVERVMEWVPLWLAAVHSILHYPPIALLGGVVPRIRILGLWCAVRPGGWGGMRCAGGGVGQHTWLGCDYDHAGGPAIWPLLLAPPAMAR